MDHHHTRSGRRRGLGRPIFIAAAALVLISGAAAAMAHGRTPATFPADGNAVGTGAMTYLPTSLHPLLSGDSQTASDAAIATDPATFGPDRSEMDQVALTTTTVPAPAVITTSTTSRSRHHRLPVIFVPILVIAVIVGALLWWRRGKRRRADGSRSR